ncbi:f-box/kelch-repeat protein [Quercus suber]|uniref:F-box/kelch-repeat protein n=1 Tax=Quercus suber TaxID=58331 RepID=A0AAW0LPT5_QUESU|nr:F-box/kelch-repeat protein At3g23880-like [Quercus suber]
MATPRWWSASLPNDIIEDILTWLPPKPLVRFRCVRQSWNSKISDPEFINKHLSMNKAKSLSLDDDNNNNNNNGYLLCRSPRPVHDPRLVMARELCTFVCNTNSDSSLTEISRLRINPIYHDSSFGFCNGICYGTITVSHPAPWNFCGTSYQWHFSKTRSPVYHTVRNAGIYLWNPSVRKHKRLPAVVDDDRFNYRSYGLAFPTSQNNDLKLLVFGCSVNREQLRAQVYTLSTNSWSWVEQPLEPLDGSVGSRPWIDSSSCLFFSGALHFIATTSQGYGFILCFDVDHEQFQAIKLPHNFSLSPELAVFKGSLALIAFDQDGVCHIWVMGQNGLADSWTPTISVPLPGVKNFLGCTSSGELVITKSDNQIFSFDLESQNENGYGILDFTEVVYTANLLESLLLLNE